VTHESEIKDKNKKTKTTNWWANYVRKW